ncbi:hypothetical protein [Lake Baikal phage Baikal-20-5m-C28]|nr:hypothetical protein [Lake Baikal phage Baikal-20-5m-C28]
MLFLLSFLPDWLFYAIAFFSFIALLLASFVKSIPIIGKYAIPIQAISFIVLVISVFFCGGLSNEASWQLKVAKANVEIAELKVKEEKVTTKIVTKYIDRIQVVKEKGNEIIKYVDVIKESDSKCELPNSFVVLHDAAAKNELPDPARITNEGASNLKLSTATTTIVENYGITNQITEQLKALQAWIREQQKINP